MSRSPLLTWARPRAPDQRAGPGYQAEDPAIFHGTVDSNHIGFTGTGFVNLTNEVGSYVEWRLSAADAGEVKLGIRYANGTTSGRPTSISVNGAAPI